MTNFKDREGRHPISLTVRLEDPTPAEAIQQNDGKQAALLIISGEEMGRVIFISQEVTLLGRSAECHGVIRDAGISRKHAEVRREHDGSVVIKDLGSTNGIYVGDLKVEQCKLREGDKILLGLGTVLQFLAMDTIDAQICSSRSHLVKALLAALSERDFIASGHAERLDNLCERIGAEIELDKKRLANLSLLAQVHDLGKVGIPDQILLKEGSLTAEEWIVMKKHPEIGCRIAQTSPDLAPIAELILKHHEKWDGSGYPLGLAGEDIPIECRILAIVDTYDAMTNDRPYRKAKTSEEALDELKRFSGSQFDPDLVRLTLELFRQHTFV